MSARRRRHDAGWDEPDTDALPTGARLAGDYLQPLADLPAPGPATGGTLLAVGAAGGVAAAGVLARGDTPVADRNGCGK